MMAIYISRAGKRAGPFTPDQLRTLLSQKKVLLTDLIWYEGLDTWRPLQDVLRPKTSPPATEEASPANDGGPHEKGSRNVLERPSSRSDDHAQQLVARPSPAEDGAAGRGTAVGQSGGSATGLEAGDADGIEAEADQRLAKAYVGKNYGYYREQWCTLAEGNTRASPNWHAAIFTVVWFAYRKMYRHSAVLLGISLLIHATATVADMGTRQYGGWVVLLLLVVVPILGALAFDALFLWGKHEPEFHAPEEADRFLEDRLRSDFYRYLKSAIGGEEHARAVSSAVANALWYVLGFWSRSKEHRIAHAVVASCLITLPYAVGGVLVVFGGGFGVFVSKLPNPINGYFAWTLLSVPLYCAYNASGIYRKHVLGAVTKVKHAHSEETEDEVITLVSTRGGASFLHAGVAILVVAGLWVGLPWALSRVEGALAGLANAISSSGNGETGSLPVVEPPYRIGDLKLDMNRSEVMRILGQPSDTFLSMRRCYPSVSYYYYDRGMRVIFDHPDYHCRSLTVFPQPHREFAAFAGRLPDGLELGALTRKAAKQTFGKAQLSDEGTCMKYPHRGLTIRFTSVAAPAYYVCLDRNDRVGESLSGLSGTYETNRRDEYGKRQRIEFSPNGFSVTKILSTDAGFSTPYSAYRGKWRWGGGELLQICYDSYTGVSCCPKKEKKSSIALHESLEYYKDAGTPYLTDMAGQLKYFRSGGHTNKVGTRAGDRSSRSSGTSGYSRSSTRSGPQPTDMEEKAIAMCVRFCMQEGKSYRECMDYCRSESSRTGGFTKELEFYGGGYR